MTRETKIGLLVGLAFIIVIGILLSDHLTSSTEPPPATLAQTGDNVRQTTTVPGGTGAPIATEVTPPQIQPHQPVPTPRELQPQTLATAIVQVGGPGAAQGTPQAAPPPITVVNEPAATPGPVQAEPPPPAVDPRFSDVAQVAQQHNETLVTVTPTGQPQPLPTSTAPPAASAGKDYIAEPGDSVSKMASKLLGANTKTNREAIIRANPTLQQDPNMVVVGKSYKIPAVPTPASVSPTAVAQQAPAAQPVRPAASTEYFYTVKEGDTLTRIAREQLGQDASAIASIMELNRDMLKGSDKIFVNMKLRLPGKPVAQAR